MNPLRSKYVRVLGIAPSSRGFGFALMEGKNTLVDWGVKAVKGDKNSRSLANCADLIALYQPNVVALEDTRAKDSRRSSRIQALVEKIIVLAKGGNIEVKLFSPKKVRLKLLSDEKGTKHALAESLVNRFPDELGFRLPRKRRIWMSEDYRMDIFEAVAYAEYFFTSKKNG